MIFLNSHIFCYLSVDNTLSEIYFLNPIENEFDY